MTKKVRIEYLLSEAGRKKSLLTGGDGKEKQVMETDITPELLERATVYQDGSAVWSVKYAPTEAKIIGTYDFSPYRLDVRDGFYEEHRPRISTKVKNIYFDEPQTAESLLTFIKDAEARIAAKVSELEALLPEKIAAWEKAVAEHKTRAAEVDAERKAREAVEKAERERREREKADWIVAHGSDHLKRATALGYDCQRQYVTERAKAEFPDYIVDFDNRAEWDTLFCPTEETLAEVEQLIEQGFDAKAAWLTHPPYKMENEDWKHYDDFPCEAIVVRGYLGKYNLVKFM
jgi:hypothetical protein